MFLCEKLWQGGADCDFALPLKPSFVLIFSIDTLRALRRKPSKRNTQVVSYKMLVSAEHRLFVHGGHYFHPLIPQPSIIAFCHL